MASRRTLSEGRKPESTMVRSSTRTRQARMHFRMTRDEKALIERAADVLGLSIAGFMASTLVSAASGVVKEHKTLTLSARDQMMLAEALLARPAPLNRLIKAARSYRRG